MTAKRNYTGKDVDMLTACSIIIENAKIAVNKLF